MTTSLVTNWDRASNVLERLARAYEDADNWQRRVSFRVMLDRVVAPLRLRFDTGERTTELLAAISRTAATLDRHLTDLELVQKGSKG